MSLTIPNNAPFNGAQKMWLQGFLDGISSTLAPSQTNNSAAAVMTGGIPVTILWGSQTGNAEGLGKKLSKSLSAKGHSPTLKSMADVLPTDLSEIAHLLIITSTYGDGEPPDNAAAFHAALLAADAPSLASLQYSVFALGDSNYPDFCKCGRDFDQRIAALGANRLTEIVECDVEFDDAFASWSAQIATALVCA
ncbi:MAG: flavodoxin domain-containing protein [Verrucomicrobiota bacterium]